MTERAKLYSSGTAALSIAQIGATDEGGGAAAVAGGLMRGYAARGHRVWHLVGRKRSADPRVVLIPDEDRLPYRVSGYTLAQSALRGLAGRHPNRGFGLASRALRYATHPSALRARLRGLEDFEFAGSRRAIDQLNGAIDVVQGHNLQGGYFDLGALDAVSARVPTVLTLHDMWLLTGHCAHSLGCDRWQSGCGECPDLRLDPAVRRDATDENWQRKRDIYSRSRLHIVTPSRWLRDRVAKSMLAPHAAGVRVIPNGVDVAIFHPGDRAAARAALGLPADAFIALLTVGSLGSMWKDDRTLREVMNRLADRELTRPIEFVAVGRESAVPLQTRARTRRVPYQHDPLVMAQYYRAADVYLHAARADTMPLAILEAMACGTPVIATAIGGIPEEIHDGANGMLVPPGGAAEMADALITLMAQDSLRAQLSANAVASIASCFTLDRQVDAYLDLYREVRQC